MKKILIVLLIISVVSGLFLIHAPAAEEGLPESTGYIVKLKEENRETASLFSADETVGAHGLVYAETEADLQRLIDSGSVLSYEPNYTVRLMGTVNDAYYVKQWNLRDTNVEAAWDAGLCGAGVTVAVIDSGINAQHEDFVGIEILGGLNVINGSDNTADELGHGTFVTGIIAASRNNRIGIAGIADQVRILPIKCFSDSDEASVLDICRGIYAAVDDYGCDIICMSLGTTFDSENMRDAVDYAAENNVILVAAVGNMGGTQLFYPAAYDSVIGTGSFDPSGLYSSFTQFNESVFVSAPGSKIYSTYVGSPDAYADADGTSFSAPHVAALAAVARSYDPGLTIDEFKTLLMNTSTDTGDEGYDMEYGWGKINFSTFVAALMDNGIGNGEGESTAFLDISDHWAEDAIEYCVSNGLFNGVSDTLFDPDGSMTRAMLVTVLYRWSGENLTGGEEQSIFADVSYPSAWYYDAVCWAAANEIVNGYTDNTFRPDDNITREQLITILYRFSGSPEEENIEVLQVFNDYESISQYALSAFAWGFKAGLIGGVGNSTLQPGGNATRAQVATIMMRYAGME